MYIATAVYARKSYIPEIYCKSVSLVITYAIPKKDIFLRNKWIR
jgi:hypothetical protein